MRRTSEDPFTGRAVELPPGWSRTDDRTYERVDGAAVQRLQRIDTASPVWWYAWDSGGFRLRGGAGQLRAWRRPGAAMAAVERHDPLDPDCGVLPGETT